MSIFHLLKYMYLNILFMNLFIFQDYALLMGFLFLANMLLVVLLRSDQILISINSGCLW